MLRLQINDYTILIVSIDSRLFLRIFFAMELYTTKKPPTWTFLTNHAHVLICITANPDIVLREVALQVGITERNVQRIVAELEECNIVTRIKEGRRNHYNINLDETLRHPIESHVKIGDFLKFIIGDKPH